MPTIECGNGSIFYSNPGNLELQNLMQALKDAVEVSTSKEVREYLEDFSDRGSPEKYKLEIKQLNERIEELEKENIKLEDELEDHESMETMECGIDVIEYRNPGNLVLQDLMENLGTAIQRKTPKRINEILAAIN